MSIQELSQNASVKMCAAAHSKMKPITGELRSGEQLSVGDVARRSGLSISSIHFYESRGLISSWRSAGNQRRYSRDVLRRLAVIKVAQRIGIPLKEIAEALEALPKARTPTTNDWKKLSTGWRTRLEQRILELTALRDRIDRCIGCGCLSMISCPLYNPDDILGAKGPGAQLLKRDS